MNVGPGLKAHSGWSALVALGRSADKLRLVDRRRIDLVDAADLAWARQPHHAAEGLSADEAREQIERCAAAAQRVAERLLLATVERV